MTDAKRHQIGEDVEDAIRELFGRGLLYQTTTSGAFREPQPGHAGCKRHTYRG